MVRLTQSTQQAITRLIIADVQNQLPGTSDNESGRLSTSMLASLMTTASALALSDDDRERSLAYEICTRTLEIVGSSVPGFVTAADLILARLGNFPGRTLLNWRYRSTSNQEHHTPILLGLEALSRQLENTVDFFEDEPITLTDFQYDLLNGIREQSTISVSAPTSAGKSFVLSIAIIERLRRNDGAIVYVVPTRALIRQVMVKVVRDLRRASMEYIPVRSISIPAETGIDSRAVFILTQERLLSLLNSDIPAPSISTLIIDEAQGIGDGARGVILQSAVDLVLARNPSANVYFASPLSSNPEYLLQIFNRRNLKDAAWTDSASPVSQNCILVHTVGHETHRARFELVGRNRRFDLGERMLPFALRGPLPQRRARFALEITGPDDCTLIYANEPSEAEEVAAALCRELPSSARSLHPDIADFVAFLREFVHPQYPLIDSLQSGVAFHYGQMPAGVRTRVEELAECGVLRFVCCTSTLLQGVNLPAKHIIIENPRKGVGKKMQRGEFLNLAGRAGRLLQEFHGNVWCIEPSRWAEKCFEGEKLTPITSAFAEVIAQGGKLVEYALVDKVKMKDRDLARAALGKVFTDFILPERPIGASPFARKETIEALLSIEEQCANIPITLPHSILRRNFTIPPQRLQALYDYLQDQPNLLDCIPFAPFTKGGYARLLWILEQVQIHLEGIENGSYRFHAVIASAWMHNRPLHIMIANRLNYLKKSEPREIGNEIRKLLETIETDIRFKYARNLKAYNDVLATLLRKAGYDEEADTLVPLHLYFELGASNPIVISLLSLGISRTTSLLLRRRMHFPDGATPEQCFAILANTDLSQLNIPAVCRSELSGILGR